MQVTYSVSPSSDWGFSLASRVLTENLLRDGRFDVHFSDAIFNASHSASNKTSELAKKIVTQNKKLSFFNFLCFPFIKIYFSTIGYKEEFLKSIKGDYLFYSGSLDVFDLSLIYYVLKNGIKVIFGGNLVFNYSIQELRRMLKVMGATEEHQKNIIFVRGFVDLTTDLYKILKEWKDTLITKNDFSTFWNCERDYIQDLVRFPGRQYETFLIKKRYSDFNTTYIFNSHCWWNKCKFCSYNIFPNINTIKNSNPDFVVKSILNTLSRHRSNSIFIADSCFLFNDKTESILKKLVKNDIKITIYSSINNLLDKKYLEKLNKYISVIKVGMESMDDFALNYIDKGYRKEDIIRSFDQIKKYLRKNIIISINMISDLPYLSESDFLKNIDLLYNLKEHMNEKGFTFGYFFSALNIPPGLENKLIDGKFLKKTTLDDEYLAGRSIVWNYLATLGLDPKLSTLYTVPYRRYDKDGSPMLNDSRLISDDKTSFILKHILY